MREQTIEAMEKQGIEVIVPSAEQTKVGCVEYRKEAEICADLFRRNNVQGIVIGAVNFGDEQSAAWTVRKAGLDVPVMIFGCQEEEVAHHEDPRRDAFCGLLSIGEVLRQIGIKYSVGAAADLLSLRRLVRQGPGLVRPRLPRGRGRAKRPLRPDGRPARRLLDLPLQRKTTATAGPDHGRARPVARPSPGPTHPRTTTRKFSEIVAADQAVMPIPRPSSRRACVRSAKLELFLRRWARSNAIDALAIQCWTSIQANYGVCSCTTMSRLGDEGVPCACESDILGTLSMHAAMLASGSPGRPGRLEQPAQRRRRTGQHLALRRVSRVVCQDAAEVGRAGDHRRPAARPATKTRGHGRVYRQALALDPLPRHAKPGRRWKALIAQGRIEDNPAVTFGGYGWCRIPDLQRLYRDVLLRHFPHHVAITQAHVGNVLWEAFGNYLGMEVYHATQDAPGLYTPRLPFYL